MPELGMPEPEKRVVINTPNKTLDALAGKSASEQQQEGGETEDPKDETSSIRTIPDEGEEETQVTSDADDTGKDTEEQPPSNEDDGNPAGDAGGSEPTNEDDGEVDLNELDIEIDGQERSVAEVIVERNELAKRVAEIESDDFLKGLIDHYKATGNIDAYYEAKGVDWDKKSDLEVLKIAFDKKNADLPDKTRELLWKKKLRSDYMIKDDLSPEELESEDYQIAQGLLERDARNTRKEFKEVQQKYKAPERKTEQAAQPQQFDAAAYKQKLLQEKEVSAFAKHKLLPLGVKDGMGKTLGFEPKDTEQIIEMMIDDRKFWNSFRDPKTKRINYTKLAKAYAYVQDPEFYEQSLVNLGKNLHLEERLKDQKQIDDRLNRKAGGPPPKESFAKGFLTAALKQQKK